MPISGHDTDEVMNMKKFLGGIKKNIFYISLITGMAVLVTVLGLYNAQTNSKEKTITIGQNTPNDSTTEADAKEALNDKKNDKNSGVSDEGTSEQKDIETDNTIENSTASTAESESAETGASGVSNDSLHYDPKDSISWPINGNVIIPYSMDTTVYFETLKEYKCSPAMVIEAQTGDEVKAVYESKVAEVSSNPELGNYVKLELGDGYTVTLGQLQDVKVALGEHLDAGQVVGTVGEPSRFYSEEGISILQSRRTAILWIRCCLYSRGRVGQVANLYLLRGQHSVWRQSRGGMKKIGHINKRAPQYLK